MAVARVEAVLGWRSRAEVGGERCQSGERLSVDGGEVGVTGRAVEAVTTAAEQEGVLPLRGGGHCCPLRGDIAAP